MRRILILALGVPAVCLATPSLAGAATLDVRENEGEYSRDNYMTIVYTAAPGETNRVTARYDDTFSTFTLSDPGAAAITPVPGTEAAERCTFTGDRVKCSVPSRSQNTIALTLGDGNDTSLLESAISWAFVDGGEGDDAITHRGEGSAYLKGSHGNDRLTGGYREDVLWGGAGADVIDGRGGLDHVTPYDYDNRSQSPTTGLVISLDGVADDGMPGEGDNVLASNEFIEGTDFADTLTGGTGDQILDGRGGDDRLAGGPGFDRYYCGDGNDAVTADDFDRLYSALYRSTDCESGAPAL